MANKKGRTYECEVIHESVRICLRDKRRSWASGFEGFVVQCDQDECQYVDENQPPCRLNLEMFADELKEREEREREKQRQRDEDNADRW